MSDASPLSPERVRRECSCGATAVIVTPRSTDLNPVRCPECSEVVPRE